MKYAKIITFLAFSVLNSPANAQSDSKQADRAALILKLKDLGVFGEVHCRPQGGDVVVRPAFFALEFSDKQQFVSVVYGYCFPNGERYASVKLLDSKTNKRVGAFSKEFLLRME